MKDPLFISRTPGSMVSSGGRLTPVALIHPLFTVSTCSLSATHKHDELHERWARLAFPCIHCLTGVHITDRPICLASHLFSIAPSQQALHQHRLSFYLLAAVASPSSVQRLTTTASSARPGAPAPAGTGCAPACTAVQRAVILAFIQLDTCGAGLCTSPVSFSPNRWASCT